MKLDIGKMLFTSVQCTWQRCEDSSTACDGRDDHTAFLAMVQL